jgi:hypothetical protein
MAALAEGTDYVIKRVSEAGGVTELLIRTLSTADATDTMTVTLPNYGIGKKGFIGLIGFSETTDNSVFAQEADTTAVSAAGVLTITIPAGSDNDRRHIIVYGHSLNP